MNKQRSKISHKKSHVEPRLDQSQIVRAALGLLGESGFDGLTMRNLAKKLGIKAASLYWHIRNKQDLLGLVAEEICAPMREPDRSQPWRKQLEDMGNEYRRILLMHRDGARVLAESGAPSGPQRLRLTEIVLRTLLDAGFDHKDAAYAGLLLSDYVTMFVLEETQDARTGTESNAKDSSSAIQSWIGTLPPTDFPGLIALADYLTQPDLEERFQFGMEILENGLETRLAK